MKLNVYGLKKEMIEKVKELRNSGISKGKVYEKGKEQT